MKQASVRRDDCHQCRAAERFGQHAVIVRLRDRLRMNAVANSPCPPPRSSSRPPLCRVFEGLGLSIVSRTCYTRYLPPTIVFSVSGAPRACARCGQCGGGGLRMMALSSPGIRVPACSVSCFCWVDGRRTGLLSKLEGLGLGVGFRRERP